jgi:hypothetical protein
MPIIHPTLKIDVLKMEQTFHFGYQEGDKVFYVSPLEWKGQEELVDGHEVSWNAHKHLKNQRFEDTFLGDLNLKSLSKGMVFV